MAYANVLPPTLYYAARTNTVHGWKFGEFMRMYEQDPSRPPFLPSVSITRFYHSSQRLYQEVPRGLPRSPFELERLVEIARGDGQCTEEDVGEACLLVIALWRMTCLIMPALHTRVMQDMHTSSQYTSICNGSSLSVPEALASWRPEVPAALWLNQEAKKGATWDNRLRPSQANVRYSHNLETNLQMQLYWVRPGIPNGHHGAIIHTNLCIHL
jgi:hypothetical protein